MTQFDMTTSTELSATGRCSISPSRNSTFVRPPLRVLPCPIKHIGRHIDTDDMTGRADPLRSKETVETRSRTQIENDLTLPERGKGHGVAAPEPQVRTFRYRFEVAFRVAEVEADRLNSLPGVTAPDTAPAPSLPGDLSIGAPHLFVYIFLHRDNS